MDRRDKEKFAQILLGISEIYAKEISDAAGDVLFNSLKDYDIEAVSDAFSRHCKNPDNGQYFPKPADIIRLIEGGSKDAAALAWSKVDKAVRRVGTYETVVFDDPIIHAVIYDMGGWISFGEKTEEEWPFVSNEFRQRYAGYKSRLAQIDLFPRQLIGISEANNGGRYLGQWYKDKGLSAPSPILIGDAEKAKSVMVGGGKQKQIFHRFNGKLMIGNNT